MKEGTIKALIAVRSGSMRVENKNIRDFCGSSLLEVKLKQLMQVSQLDGVVVNSNDDEMLAVASRLGAQAVKRDEYYASNTVSMSEVYRNMAYHTECDHIMYANATNPLTDVPLYEEAIRQYRKSGDDTDSLVSVCDVKEFLWQNGLPLNYDPLNQPRSQDLPDIVKLNFAISILPRDLMITKMNVVGNRPAFFRMNETDALDIDTELDFLMAAYLYKGLKIEGLAVQDLLK